MQQPDFTKEQVTRGLAISYDADFSFFNSKTEESSEFIRLITSAVF